MRKLNTEDMFKMFRIIKSANLKEEIKALYAQAKGEASAEKIGISFTLVLVEAMANVKVENEIYAFLSGITGLEEKAIKEQPLEETTNMLKDIAKENDLKSFFGAVTSLAKA